VVELLLNRSADVNVKDSTGMTPLQFAQRKSARRKEIIARRKEVIELLRKHGAKEASTDSKVIKRSLTPPPKGRGCFPADTTVLVDGALVQISTVVSGQMVGSLHCKQATERLEQIEAVEEHEGKFECRDIVLESGNRIGVVDAHCFMLDSGQWIAAQDLKNGLRLKTFSGTVGIKSVATRAEPFVGRVYNLKIRGTDQYFIGKDKLIVRDY
jgi:hypothetical protein